MSLPLAMFRPMASERNVQGGPPERIPAAGGIVYGPPRSAARWGSAGCPIAPRAYRTSYRGKGAPALLKDLAGDPALTVGDLHRGLWDRLPQRTLPKKVRQAIGHELGRLNPPAGMVALPAGVPLAWVAELPLRTRTCNAVARLIGARGGGRLAEALSIEDVMAWPQAGVGTLLDLLCVLESAELDDLRGLTVFREPPAADAGAYEQRRTWMTPGQRCLYDLASWALSETGAVTLGEALSLLGDMEAAPSEWANLTELLLRDLTDFPPHPYDYLESWASRLPDRKRLIFERRLAFPRGDKATLQELGDELGITKERVRQLNKIILEGLLEFVASDAGRPISWRLDTIRRMVNTIAPADRVEKLLAPPEGSRDYSDLFLRLAGPYSCTDGWLILEFALAADPTPSILDMADELGRIDMTAAGEVLRQWGLEDQFHLAWLTRRDQTIIFKGQLVRKQGALAEKLSLVLDDLGSPSTAEKIAAIIRDEVGLDRSINTIKNALLSDDRFVRATRSKWALTSWGFPEYTGIASLIRRLLEETGPMLVEDVAERLASDFETKRSSARIYCEVPAFVVEEGRVRLRREGEAYVYPNSKPGAGVFVLGEERLGLLFRIDRDVLRGSGRLLGPAAGAILGVAPNDRLVFRDPNGLSLAVAFPDMALNGPSLGSQRRLAEAAGAELDDYLNLVFDRDDMSVAVTVTRLEDHEPGWPLAARLTGIDRDAGLDGLASALQCDPEDVESALRDRGDHTVADALPLD